MTGLDKDLATLRAMRPEAGETDLQEQFLAALDRVEAELARLNDVAHYADLGNSQAFLDYWFHIGKTCGVREAVEDLLSENVSLREERDAALDREAGTSDALQLKHDLLCEAIRRGEAAEARCAELEEDLRDERNDAVQDEAYIKRLKARCARLQQALVHHGYGPRLCKCANCRAAGPDTPADSQPEETA